MRDADFSSHKLFVCVYMSHGHENGVVCAADKEFNHRETIIQPIMENTTLNGTARIFITVACRGDSNYEEVDRKNNYDDFDGVEVDGRILSTGTGIDYSNCIFSYSTYEGKLKNLEKKTRNQWNSIETSRPCFEKNSIWDVLHSKSL